MLKLISFKLMVNTECPESSEPEKMADSEFIVQSKGMNHIHKICKEGLKTLVLCPLPDLILLDYKGDIVA